MKVLLIFSHFDTIKYRQEPVFILEGKEKMGFLSHLMEMIECIKNRR